VGGIYATPKKYVTDCNRRWQRAQHIHHSPVRAGEH